MPVPPAIKVDLLPHDPCWAEQAENESRALAAAIGPCLIRTHHIGSTAIPGIYAKPILDLLPVVTEVAALEQCRRAIEALGYAWWGELGLPGRRYCTKSCPATGVRLVQLHCFAHDSPEIARHLAFRDHLRSKPDVALAYSCEKRRCSALHPDDSHAYTDCKAGWIRAVEAEALACREALL